MPSRGLRLGMMVVTALLLACSAPAQTAPSLAADTVGVYFPPLPYTRILPVPAHFHVVWDQTAECVSKLVPLSGKKFEEIKWYSVDADVIPMPNGTWANGYYDKGHIFIRAALLDQDWIIAHESIHALTNIPDHPPEVFVPCVNERFPEYFPHP